MYNLHVKCLELILDLNNKLNEWMNGEREEGDNGDYDDSENFPLTTTASPEVACRLSHIMSITLCTHREYILPTGHIFAINLSDGFLLGK